MRDVLIMLENEADLPLELKAHRLSGEYKDCMECHIEGDFLLIWLNDDIIDLLRLGSHAELYDLPLAHVLTETSPLIPHEL